MKQRPITVGEALFAAGLTPEDATLQITELQKHFIQANVNPSAALVVCIAMSAMLGMDAVKRSAMTEADVKDGMHDLLEAFLRVPLPAMTKEPVEPVEPRERP